MENQNLLAGAMHLLKRFTLMLGLAAFTACEQIPPKVPLVTNTSQAFFATWNARLDKYREDFVAKDTALREKAAASIEKELASSADPWNTLVTKVSELSAMVREAYTIAGRGETIKAFIIHMEAHPSAGLSDVWFLRQGEDAQSEAREVDAKAGTFFSTLDQKVGRDMKWILEFERLAREQGMVTGKIQELQSLHAQAESYYLDMRRAEAADKYKSEEEAKAKQNAARTLSELGRYYNQLNYQQQLLNNLNRPRICNFFANTMTCQ